MKIDCVTFTGADESVTVDQIVRLTEEYPTIKTEWGLLLSKSLQGHCPRYPSLDWVEFFVKEAKLALAGHLQGKWLHCLAVGGDFSSNLQNIHQYFNRIQFNFHGGTAIINNFFSIKHPDKQFILQMDGINNAVYPKLTNIFPLFDTSAGNGIIPKEWPKPLHPTINGYAGGLGPDTIKEQLKRIENVVGEGTIWLDMENNIRSDNDQLFDLDKCRRVLDVVVERVL